MKEGLGKWSRAVSFQHITLHYGLCIMYRVRAPRQVVIEFRADINMWRPVCSKIA